MDEAQGVRFNSRPEQRSCRVGRGGYEQIDGPDANLMPAGDRRPVWGWRCSALVKYLVFFLLPDPITNAP